LKRILPEVTPDTVFFWESGSDGRLRFLRCDNCGNYIHPPAPICPKCLTRHPSPHEVSGDAVVASFTINHQAWEPSLEVPYMVALVEIVEQPSVRLTTNIVNCGIQEVYIGMPVRVTFQQEEDVYLPLFEPDPTRVPVGKTPERSL
jgi:uncharacterized protein